MYVYETTNLSMIKNVYRLKIVQTSFTWVLEWAPGLT
jgi:hypothetical protein